MDLSGVDIKPAEGMIAVKFVDDADDEAYEPEGFDNEGVLAIVLGVGAKTKVKKGDTVITRSYARDGTCLGDGVHLIDDYCILATIGK